MILPQRNGPDLDDVPEAVLAELEVRLVSDVSEVLDIALAPADDVDRGRVVEAA